MMQGFFLYIAWTTNRYRNLVKRLKVFVCVCLNTTAQQVASLQDKMQLQCVPYR